MEGMESTRKSKCANARGLSLQHPRDAHGGTAEWALSDEVLLGRLEHEEWMPRRGHVQQEDHELGHATEQARKNCAEQHTTECRVKNEDTR